MASESKTEKATRIYELLYADRIMQRSRKRSSKHMQEAVDNIYGKITKLQIELREKHYTDEQLDALLDFYDSELGKSITETEGLVAEEFSSRMNTELESSVDSNYTKGLGSIVNKREHRDDDT